MRTGQSTGAVAKAQVRCEPLSKSKPCETGIVGTGGYVSLMPTSFSLSLRTGPAQSNRSTGTGVGGTGAFNSQAQCGGGVSRPVTSLGQGQRSAIRRMEDAPTH